MGRVAKMREGMGERHLTHVYGEIGARLNEPTSPWRAGSPGDMVSATRWGSRLAGR